LEKITRQACTAVLETAAYIRESLGQVHADQIEEKFCNGLVSYVDRTAEEMLVKKLAALLPEAGFLTEEETVEQSNRPWQWIIDPLDGTTNFLHQIPHFAISVGLTHEQQLVVGIIHHVMHGETFFAWLGGGAYCQNLPIRVSQRNNIRDALLSTGFPYHNFDHETAYFNSLKAFTHTCRGVRRFGSAALDLAYVACGKYDAFYEYGLSPWDVAGGALLIKEAGGIVCDFSGGPDFMEKKQIIACSQTIYNPVLEIIRQYH
jgi:myo-inositol-1(or 4)-monophosphatase